MLTASRPADRHAAFRAVLRTMFFVSLVAAPIFVIFPILSGLLILDVIVLVLSGGLLVGISLRPRRGAPGSTASRAGDPGVPDGTAERSQRAAGREVVRLASFLAVLAVVIAAAIFDWRLLVVGAVLTFAGMALFGLPVWLAAASDAAEDEAARRPGRPGLQP